MPASATPAKATPVKATPARADCDQLLDTGIKFARRMLDEEGEFLPFGIWMLPDGETAFVTTDAGDSDETSLDMVDLILDSFRAGAANGELRATAIVYDVRLRDPRVRRGHAILAALDHRDLYSVKVIFPYEIEGGRARLSDPFASDGDHAIFPCIQ